ncbi:MAG: penicillin acylase family protein [Roseovarius sp.]
MAQVFKWLVRIAGGMILLGLIVLLGVYFLLSRSLPDYSKDLDVIGLLEPVEIVRDNANVPHIFGTNDPDTFYGLGYAHAQDRLWQMVTTRAAVQGRLSEIFGTRTVEFDKRIRRFDLYALAQSSVAAQDAQTIAALRAYSAGVNARLKEINSSALGRGAPEMFLFNAPVAPWTPADSIAIVKFMAVQLSSHLEEEVLYARTSLELEDQDRLADILPLAPGSGVAALPDYASLFPEGTRFARSAAPDMPDDPLSPFRSRAFAGASNAWAAAPKRSAAGGTLLANDPHLALSAPAIWYLARLELQTGGVIGATIPGVPAVMAGRSAQLGWGVTSSYLDDQDLFIERLNPDNPQEYLTPDGYKPFRTESTIIRIKDAKPITLTLRWTENGPVLPGSLYHLADVTPPGHVASLAWTALSDSDTTLSAAMSLMRAQSVQEGIAAGEAYVAPSQNLTLVDQSRIAMKTIGTMPRRAADHETRGRYPSRGWEEKNRWQGSFGYSANPEFVDPGGGLLGNTNNKTVERPFPNHVSYKWGDTQRIYRWRRLMQNREVHTRDSFIEAQLDTVSFTARSLLPLIGKDLWFTGEAAPEGTPERQRQRALNLLSEWTGEMNEHLPEPLIYAAWLRELQRRLIVDDLGPLAEAYTHPDPVFIERVPHRRRLGLVRYPSHGRGNCRTSRIGASGSGSNHGSAGKPAGAMHQATAHHQLWGRCPLKYCEHRRHSAAQTLLAAHGQGPDPFQNVHGAGYRGVYDFNDPDSSVFITATGQSGHFLSRHYDDMAQLWRRGEYIPMSLDADLARAASVGVTRLTPVAP